MTPPVDSAVMARARTRKLTLLLTSSLAFLAPSAIAPGLPALYADFADVPDAALLSRLVLTMPMLFVALSGPFVGLAADRLGRRTTLVTATLGYGLAGISGLFLESLFAIIAGRAVLGICLAGILTSVTALIGDYYAGHQRNQLAGLQGAFISFGTVSFVVIAGVLAEIHWRAGFTLFAVAFLLVPPMLLSLYEPRRAGRASAEAAGDAPTGRRDWIAIGWLYLLAFACMIALFMIPSQTQFFLIEIGVSDPTSAGLAIGIFSISSGIASLAFPWLRRRFSSTAIYALLFLDVGVGFVLVGLSTGFLDVVIAMVVGGFSMGAFIPNTNMVIISRAASPLRGRALGGLTAAFFLGQFASPFYSVPVAERLSVGGTFVVTGYGLLALGSFFVVLALFRRWRRARPVTSYSV